MALPKKKSHKLWVWKAYCRDRKQLIDWECGDRDEATFQRLKKRLEQWRIRLICTDDYKVYDRNLSVGQHHISKGQTVMIERNNGRQRHWYGRFKRKSIVVSKSDKMIDLTMALFSSLYVDHGLEGLIHSFHESLLWEYSLKFHSFISTTIQLPLIKEPRWR